MADANIKLGDNADSYSSKPVEFRFELELSGIVANHADLAFGKSAGRFGRDFKSNQEPRDG